MHRIVTAACAAGVLLTPIGAALAQQGTGVGQRAGEKAPISQAWIDLATFSSPGMPAGMGAMMMGGMPGGGGDSPPLSALLGGRNQDNQFGNTRYGGSGRYMDVTLRTSRNPNLSDALQSVPAASQLAPTLHLRVLPEARPAPESDDDTVQDAPEQPKARISLYWGCGATIRPGQPKVVDLSTGTVGDLAAIFKGRRATQRGAHAAPGRPVWPNPTDKRLIPDGASLAGAHAFAGDGVPEGFQFTLPTAQDLMPPIALRQATVGGVTQLSWRALPTARAYFLSAMGGKGDSNGDGAEMTLWTSSELPDSGFGLIDYQTNKSIDQWLKEKVLLAPETTNCDIPKGIFSEGEGGMLRMIAYGTEIDLEHPPRPADPKSAWTPEWALKVRVKSVASTILGMPAMDGGSRSGRQDPGDDGGTEGTPGSGESPAEQPGSRNGFGLQDALDAMKHGGAPLP